MYYFGWDGGGTKTQVCAVDEQGTQLAVASFGPLNPVGNTRETVEKSVRDSIAWMDGLPGCPEACRGLVVGAAGISSRHTALLLEEIIKGTGFTRPYRLVGDQEIALAGAVRGPGAILIAGTGSVCFGRNARGNTYRTGGYGHLIDDEGSGYAIGRDILAALVRAEDGRGPTTCLTALVQDTLKISTLDDIITWLYAPDTGKKDVAALAPLLLTALERGDVAAQAIVQHAAEELSELVIAAWRRLHLEEGELAFCGSIFGHYPAIREGVTAYLKAALPDLRVIEPRNTAAYGAALLAMEAFGDQKA